MGGVASSPRFGGEVRPQETSEYLMGEFVGNKSFPLASDYWKKLLELPLDLRWRSDRVQQACQLLAMNNRSTRHLAKILIHLAWCLQEYISSSNGSSSAFSRALNATYISSVFLKYLIEESKSDNFEELVLSLDEAEPFPNNFSKGEQIEGLVMCSVLSFVGKVDVSAETYLLHQALLSFITISMSTQLLSGPSPGPSDIHPFIDAAMAQDNALVNMVVRKLLINYLRRPHFASNNSFSQLSSEGNESGVLMKVGSAAASLIRLPINYLINSNGESSRSPLAEASLNVLLLLSNYRKCISEDYVQDKLDNSSFEPLKKETCFSGNPFCKALENAQDTEFDRNDIEGNGLPLVKIPFASLLDTLGMCLANETSVLLLYLLVHGNPNFLEYVLVRTDIDTLLMPMLETLYNAPAKTPNHIYMVLVIFLILSQDPSFNASIHKLILPSIPWYQECRLTQTSFGSFMVIILIRTMRYNLSKMRDIYLHTNCLATLANMAPHIHRLSAYASQRLVSLFDMLSRKYNKLAEIENAKMLATNGDPVGENLGDDTLQSADLHVYIDFLRLVLEILNAILTYALPRNPEVVYAVMHRQEVFLPFKNHPRFNELLENIYTVLDFFNSRVDAEKTEGDWSVEKVLQVIIHHCRSWRGEGMKMFTLLRFTYEQESHPEEFFIPYIWQLVLSHGDITFNPGSIHLFLVHVDKIPSDGDLEH